LASPERHPGLFISVAIKLTHHVSQCALRYFEISLALVAACHTDFASFSLIFDSLGCNAKIDVLSLQRKTSIEKILTA
jgi:hypothetical protein